MAVEQLKNGGGGEGTPFGKKTAVPFDRRYLFNACLTQRNIKIVYPIKCSDFFVYRLLRRSFSGTNVLFEVVSQKTVSSTTAQFRCFLDFTTEHPSVAN